MSKWLMIFVFAFVSCAKDTQPSGDLNGTYNGKYLQTGLKNDSGVVKIVFVGSNFSGESVGSQRPVCNGSYLVTGDSINFKNLCSTPDSLLLLTGRFKFTTTVDSLYFIRNNVTAGNVEKFSLKKQ
jgi:hypothetical protein